MTPAANSFTATPLVIAQSLFELWLLPMRLAQNMFATGVSFTQTATSDALTAANDIKNRTSDVIEDAEEKIAKIDEGSKPAIIHPGALVG
jgi:hypothetical protein